MPGVSHDQPVRGTGVRIASHGCMILFTGIYIKCCSVDKNVAILLYSINMSFYLRLMELHSTNGEINVIYIVATVSIQINTVLVMMIVMHTYIRNTKIDE